MSEGARSCVCVYTSLKFPPVFVGTYKRSSQMSLYVDTTVSTYSVCESRKDILCPACI